jgi:hypothetical protein
MHKLCEYIDEELMELERKVGKGQKLNAAEVEYGDKLAHWKKSLLTNEAMEGEDEEYSSYGGMSYADGNMRSRGGSYARGRSYARRRDSMGRYSSEGYSRAGEMISELNRLMEDAPDERTRQEFQRFISKIESM